jgi:hypothetical protein
MTMTRGITLTLWQRAAACSCHRVNAPAAAPKLCRSPAAVWLDGWCTPTLTSLLLVCR